MRRRSDSLKANLCQAQQRDLKTIAPLSHRPIVLTDSIDYRTIVFCTIVLTLESVHTETPGYVTYAYQKRAPPYVGMPPPLNG